MMMIRMKKQRDKIGLDLDNSMNAGNISLLRDARWGGPSREGAKCFFFFSLLCYSLDLLFFIYFFSLSLLATLMISWKRRRREGERKAKGKDKKSEGG